MNRSLIPLAVAASLLLAGCEQKAADQPAGGQALDTDAAKISYIMGVNIGSQMKADQFQLDSGAFLRGVEDMMAGKPPQLSDEEANAVVKSYQEKRQAAHEEEHKKAAAANQEEGQKYLAENAKREGVTVLPSGLQYRVVTKGDGKAPVATDTVEVHYRGTLIDGTEFDSSYKRGEPVTFPVKGVIPGWVEALQLMPVGSKWEVYIPSELAYGPGGAGGQIGPNSTLKFEVELLSIEPTQEAAEGAKE